MKKMNILLGMVLVGATSVASADALFINDTGLVGVGTNIPDKQVHVLGPTGAPEALYKLEQTDAKKVRFSLKNPAGAWTFDISADATTFAITKVGLGEMLRLTDSGQLIINGTQIHP